MRWCIAGGQEPRPPLGVGPQSEQDVWWYAGDHRVSLVHLTYSIKQTDAQHEAAVQASRDQAARSH